MCCHFCSGVVYFSVFIRCSLCTESYFMHLKEWMTLKSSTVVFSLVKKVLKEIEVNSCKSRRLNISLPSLQYLNDIDLYFLCSNSSFHETAKALALHNSARKLLEIISWQSIIIDLVNIKQCCNILEVHSRFSSVSCYVPCCIKSPLIVLPIFFV